MQQEKFWILLSKKYAKEATEKELIELEALIRQHPEWQYAIQNLEELWQQKPSVNIHEEEDAYLLHVHKLREKNISFDFAQEESGEEVNASGSPGKKYLRWLAFSGIAALFIFCAFLIFNSGVKKKTDAQPPVAKNVNEISTRHGSKSTVHLPDGSIVWLNAGSKLVYDKDFGNKIREVVLSGEGYFEVARIEDKPFIIHTKTIDIKVLGTAFNVKAYPGDKTTETSLIYGKIEVSVKNRPNDKITLKPNEKLVVENEVLAEAVTKPRQPSQPVIAISTVRYNPVDSIAEETLWRINKLVIRAETFREIALKMERWYDVNIDIQIKDKSFEEKEFNVIFENETIETALDALSLNTPFKYERKGKKIIIYAPDTG